MSSFNADVRQLSRYLSGGVFNTAVGLATIVLLMAAGVPPLLANAGGYAAGLGCSFVINRRYVFQSDGFAALALLRYVGAFVVSFLGNLLVLAGTLALGLHALLGQCIAAVFYTVSMYVLCRFHVFR